MKEDTPIIGFDAKRAVANGTGLGSYSRTLINDLARYPLTLRLYAPDEGRDDLRTQIQDRANVTLHTPHSTFHIPHSTFHIPHSTFHIPPSSFLLPPSSENPTGAATASSASYGTTASNSTTVFPANCPSASVRAASPVWSPSTTSSSSATPNITIG